MPWSPDNTNLNDSNLELLLSLGWITSDSIPPQTMRARRSPTSTGTYTPPVDEPGHNQYEESLVLGEHFTLTPPTDQSGYSQYEEPLVLDERFTPVSPSTHRWSNQNTTTPSQYFAVNNNHHQDLATTNQGSMTSPLAYRQQNQSTAQYFTIHSNGHQALASPFDGLADPTTRAAPPVAFVHGQALPWQEGSHPGGIAPGAMSNGFTNGERPHANYQGREQTSPTPVFRCDRPDCTYRGTFSVKGSLTRHIAEQHTAPRSFPCPSIGCGKTYPRNSHVTDHLLKAHGIRVS
ncbi:hypothetical protein N7463_002050 [Penicillium fimorum]|uniref:C2H2-type domain-containing protein n=1 Tax=Penicillium fimorum TaxID=1882269 RepID=A0A9W9XYE2_9EURO|nr:hypothetical protein N7463_002050 [Penicillium fimorum]